MGHTVAIHRTPVATVRSFGLHYTAITNEVMAKIETPDAMAVWVYLLSKSSDWIPREADIMARWGFGRERYLKAMKHLRQLGLVWTHTERDGGGRIVGNVVNVGSIPLEWASAIDSTVSQVSRLQDEPISGGPDLLLIDRDITKISIQTKFDEFYTHYPRHQGKADAQKAWKSVIKSLDEANLVIEHIQSRQWPSDKAYIPLPATFLRGKRWEDELDAPSESTGAYL